MKWVRLILVVMILGKSRRCVVIEGEHHAGCLKPDDCILNILGLLRRPAFEAGCGAYIIVSQAEDFQNESFVSPKSSIRTLG